MIDNSAKSVGLILSFIFGACSNIDSAQGQEKSTENLFDFEFSLGIRDERVALNGILGLYLTLNDYGTLPTEKVAVRPGQDLVSRMVELNEWPSFLGGGELVLASLLCDLNSEYCERDFIRPADKYKGFVVNDYLPSQPRWARLNEEGMLTIPRLGISYEFDHRRVRTSAIESLKENGYDGLPVEATSDFLRVYCGASTCDANQLIPNDWDSEATAPSVLVYEPLPANRLQMTNDLDSIAKNTGFDQDRLFQLLSDENPFSVMAVPVMKGNYSLDMSIEDWEAGAGTVVQQRIGAHTTLSNTSILGGSVELEASHSSATELPNPYSGSVWMSIDALDTEMQEKFSTLKTAVYEQRMPKPHESNDRQVVIYHVDGWADLNHCHFALASKYIEFELADLDLKKGSDNDSGYVPLKRIHYSDERIAECKQQLIAGGFLRKEHDMEQYPYGNNEHGTGTLSALVGALAYLDVLSSNRMDYSDDLKPWLIIHVPITAKRPDSIFKVAPYSEDEKILSSADLSMQGLLKVQTFFKVLQSSFSLPPPNLINFSASLRGGLQSDLDGFLNSFDQDSLNPIIIAAAAKPVAGDSGTPQETCSRFPVSAGNGNVASVVGVRWEVDNFALIDVGTAGKSCHTVASLGKIPTPSPSGLEFRYAQGSSFAAPVLTAAVAHLLRNGAADGTFPKDLALSNKHVEEIIRWVLATSTFAPFENQFSKGGRADIPLILNYGKGLIEAKGNCRISDFDSHYVYHNDTRQDSWPLVCQSTRRRQDVSNSKLESLSRADGEFLWILLPDKEDVCDGKSQNFLLMQEFNPGRAFKFRKLVVRREQYDIPGCEQYFKESKLRYEIPLDKVLRVIKAD